MLALDDTSQLATSKNKKIYSFKIKNKKSKKFVFDKVNFRACPLLTNSFS